MTTNGKVRIEKDALGSREVPLNALYGIHTLRATENFSLAGQPMDLTLIHAYGTVKLACAEVNTEIGVWNEPVRSDAIRQAARELSEGNLDEHILVDALQGGAGNSLNMNVNEVIANRALQILDQPLGSYKIISPLDDVNKHQSTNDTYPTALKLATILRVHRLEECIIHLQEAFQEKEAKFADIVKVGRTQMQDEVLTTLGREMSAYAEALARDRWRIDKCEARLHVVNLGGTAIGTGITAPRAYILRVAEKLRDLTRIDFERAENLIEATQNVDVFVEVSGCLKTCATTLFKISNDLKFLSSGPESGIGEIRIPAVQAGSSIMPGKVNPVILEASAQAAMQVMGNDQVITQAAANGHLELNPYLPLIAHNLLTNVELLIGACDLLSNQCVQNMSADESTCQDNVETSVAVATALVGRLGNSKITKLVNESRNSGKTIRELVISKNWLMPEEFEALIGPDAVCAIGTCEPVKETA